MSRARKRRMNVIQKLQMYLVLVVCATIILIAAFMSGVIMNRSEAAMKARVSELVDADTHQLQININNYLEKVEYTASLMFANEEFCNYDVTDSNISEYEKVKMQKKITDRIVDVGLMQNFSDFGIVYRNDQTIGWISKGTQALFNDKDMFSTFEKCIINERTEDGWDFGVKGNLDRFYYVKRLNANAILVASFYGRELSSVFEIPQELEDVTISLADDDNAILYSSNKENIGDNLSPELSELLKEKNDVIAMDESMLVTSNYCRNGWVVVCSVPLDSVLKEQNQLKEFVFYFTIILVVIFISVAIFVLCKLSNPVSGMVNELTNKAEHDALSGLMNKASYVAQVTEVLSNSGDNRIIALMMFDIDNFKQVNDRLGHVHGDEVIKRMGALLKEFEDPRTVIGRIGGDEFSALKEFSNVSEENAIGYMDTMLKQVLRRFAEVFSEERKECNVSLSAGVTVCVANKYDYETLYKQADVALYVSKRSGKDQFTWYKEGMKNEK